MIRRRGRIVADYLALGSLFALGLRFIHRFPIPDLHEHMLVVVPELEGCTG
jgi:hypothetical protein